MDIRKTKLLLHTEVNNKTMEMAQHNLILSFLTLNKFLLYKDFHITGYFSTLYTIIFTLHRKAAS